VTSERNLLPQLRFRNRLHFQPGSYLAIPLSAALRVRPRFLCSTGNRARLCPPIFSQGCKAARYFPSISSRV